MLSFSALLLLILWLLQTTFLDAFYRAIKVMEVKGNAGSISDNIDHRNLSKLIDSIARESNVCIEVLDDGGDVLYSAEVQKDCVIHKMSASDKLKLLAGAGNGSGEFYEYRTVTPFKPPDKGDGYIGRYIPNNAPPMESLIYVKLVQTSSGRIDAILMNAVITPLSATVTTLRYQLYLVTLIMVLLSVILALAMAKLVSRPMEDINRSAKVLAGGNYDTHFNGQGFLEISELSDTLNTTAIELNKVETLRRELLANISHDLRTPLSLIYGYAEVMHDFPEEITREQTQTIMDETKRLASLVNDVLDVSKLETGIRQLEMKEFNLTASLKATTERTAELVRKEGYQITFDYGRDITIRGDELTITQVFYNLLVNAINHTGDDKKIAICQIVDSGYVRIEVEDTGEGIDPKDINYIWDRYYKVDKRHKRATTGTGLGLSIVKKAMELHKGQYGVRPSGSGKGSVFWFSLKLHG